MTRWQAWNLDGEPPFSSHAQRRRMPLTRPIAKSALATPRGVQFFLADRHKLVRCLITEAALEKLVQVSPDSADSWYTLAAVKAGLGKTNEVLPPLGHALDLSAKRRQANPAAQDLLAMARADERFAALRPLPEFQKLVPPK